MHHSLAAAQGSALQLDVPQDVKRRLQSVEVHKDPILVLAAALQHGNLHRKVVFVTKDFGKRVKADMIGVNVEDYRKQEVSELYKGFRRLRIAAVDFDRMMANEEIDDNDDDGDGDANDEGNVNADSRAAFVNTDDVTRAEEELFAATPVTSGGAFSPMVRAAPQPITPVHTPPRAADVADIGSYHSTTFDDFHNHLSDDEDVKQTQETSLRLFSSSHGGKGVASLQNRSPPKALIRHVVSAFDSKLLPNEFIFVYRDETLRSGEVGVGNTPPSTPSPALTDATSSASANEGAPLGSASRADIGGCGGNNQYTNARGIVPACDLILQNHRVRRKQSVQERRASSSYGRDRSFEDYSLGFALRYMNPLFSSSHCWNIQPRSDAQRATLELLNNPSVKIVTCVGKAGSGKTMLALAAALHQTFCLNRFESILISRPIVPMGGGKDLGALPGEIDSKLLPWMQPVYDALNILVPNKGTPESKRSAAEIAKEEALAANPYALGVDRAVFDDLEPDEIYEKLRYQTNSVRGKKNSAIQVSKQRGRTASAPAPRNARRGRGNRQASPERLSHDNDSSSEDEDDDIGNDSQVQADAMFSPAAQSSRTTNPATSSAKARAATRSYHKQSKPSSVYHEIVENMTQVKAKEKIHMEATAMIRGRSFVNCFILIDEAQSLTPHEVKTIVSRAGARCKVVLCGDTAQIDSPFLNSKTSGLTYCAERLKNTSIHGHITLQYSERSDLAAIAAKFL